MPRVKPQAEPGRDAELAKLIARQAADARNDRLAYHVINQAGGVVLVEPPPKWIRRDEE
jgi:hypothetical protein